MKSTYKSKSCLGLGLAISALMLVGVSPGCATQNDAAHEEVSAGKLSMALETFSSAGIRYRLRNAKFRINSVRTGEKVKTLNSEKDPTEIFLSAELDVGEYAVTLQDGWFLERLGGGPILVPLPEPTPFPGTVPPIPGDAGSAVVEDDEPDGDVPVGNPGFPGQVPGGGFGGAGGEFGEVVPAQLVSDAIRTVFIDDNDDQFIFYSFQVGDETIEFGRGRLNIGIDVFEPEPEPPVCEDPIAIERRALFETTRGATSFFNMRDVFSAIATNEQILTPPELLYRQIIDSYNSPGEAQLADAIHCGDEMTDGQPSLNGFPIVCDRQERFQFDNLDEFFPTAVVNRFDLAPENGAHCGQQRIIFANNAQNRMFFIFEAQVENPNPEAGIFGCQPVAEFWATQATIADPTQRGLRLQQAFLTGLAELEEQGVGPFVTASAYTIGSGQIRTNQFDDFPWTLREFKLALADDSLTAVPFPVAEAPNGRLWNDTIDTPQGPECREAFIGLIDNVLSDDPAEMSFPVPEVCKDAESLNDFSQDYPGQLLSGNPDGFIAELAEALGGTELSPRDFAARAQFSGSCIDCHSEAVGQDLGGGISAPFSNGFVHVDEFGFGECRDDACFRISPAVRDVFMPHRKDVLTRFVELPFDDECEPFPGAVDAGAPSPSSDSGIVFPEPDPGFVQPEPTPPGSGLMRPVLPVVDFTPVLPSAAESVADLAAKDSSIRKTFGRKTLGGQSATRSH